MPSRSRQAAKEYKRYREQTKNSNVCQFCEIEQGNPELVEMTKSLKVITNRFPYSLWDGQGVTDHLMIVPKKHLYSLNDLTLDEAHEYLQLVSRYEKDGYNIYARAPASNRRTIVHQHTHLIKLDGSSKKVIVYNNKPKIIFFK